MATTAIDDAKRFLFLHPWSTTEADNPVRLLEEVIKEFDDAIVEKLDEERRLEQAEEERADAVGLLAFIKGLRDDLKISEAEYQIAVGLVG